ncbi:spore coat protein YlbD [Virgibacillus flavescens]|uniref:spore coat protein YlbD n=1 Tax=Virgibacillus flavescens TaxID=1611422 RepID=UPI003D3589F8
MRQKEIDSSVLEFREFIAEHPKLIKAVRQGNDSWQPYYEKWVLLGEDDPCWDKYKSGDDNKSKESNVIDKIRKWTADTDMEQLQDKVEQWEQTISIIQGMLNHLQDNKQEKGFNHKYYDNKYRD